MTPMTTPEGRRAWALSLMAGAAITMTLYAATALYLVRADVTAVLTLGMSAHAIIFVVVTGFAALLVKRTLRASVLGSSFESSDQGDAIHNSDSLTISREPGQ